MNKYNALLVFVKNPQIRKIKTRLQPEMSEEERFLDDVESLLIKDNEDKKEE